RKEMKDKLQKMLSEKNTRKAEIVKSIEASESVEDIKRFSADLEKLNGEIRDLEAMLADLPDEAEARTAAVTAPIPPVVKAEAEEARKAPAEVKTDDSKVYRSLGEQLADIKKAAMGYGVTPALEKSQRSILGMNTQVGSEGGYAIQVDFSNRIMDSVIEQSDILNRIDRYQVSANANEVYVTMVNETTTANVFGGVQAYVVEEGAQIPNTKPALKQIRLPLKKIAALAYVTDEQLRDAQFTGSLLERAFALAIARLREKMIIENVIANPGTTTIAKESGQSAATVVGKNFLKMRNALISTSRRNAIWTMHPDVAAELPEMYLSGTHTDNFIYMPENGISVAGYDRLFGREIIESDYCSALGTKGDVLYWNPMEYLEIFKGGIDTATSIHVAFDTAQMAFRAISYVNGMCKYDQGVTLVNSAVARASYVTLATRA
ncbi:MAG: phage major capsid protein, partial [Erysipelotrichaceae bacterium]|nr:phage major capsid protein [Erysipelotrichaceae bacterium]